MRFYHLLNLQNLYGFLFPTLVFMIVFGLALKYSHFNSEDAERRKKTIIYRFPDDIEDRDAPFPLSMTLIIAGAVLWVVSYILGYGLLEVPI